MYYQQLVAASRTWTTHAIKFSIDGAWPSIQFRYARDYFHGAMAADNRNSRSTSYGKPSRMTWLQRGLTVWDRTQFRRRRRLAACVATGPVGDMAWFGPGGSDRAWVAVRDLAAFPCICHFLLQIKSSRKPPLPALELWVQIVFFYDTESLDVFGELALGYLGQSYLAQANSPPIK